MEAASNNRGRPRIHDAEHVANIARAAWGSRATTARQQQALWFVQQAAAALLNPKTHGFIKGVDQLINNNPPRMRTGVLEQLGRLLVETDCPKSFIRDLARTLSKRFASESDMTVRKAEALLREARRAAKQ